MTNVLMLIFYILNYMLVLYSFALILPNKILSLFELIKYLKFINFYYTFLFIIFNIIGLPPFVGFFIKLNLFYYFLNYFNINVFFCIFLINIVIILFYGQIFYLRSYSDNNINFKNYFQTYSKNYNRVKIVYIFYFFIISSIFMKLLICVLIGCLKYDVFLKAYNVFLY